MKHEKASVFYIFIGLLFVAMVFVTFRFFKGSGGSTVGVTYAKEYKINTEKSALVKRVHVVSGQEVKTGDILVELSSSEMEIDIDKLQNRISILKKEQAEKTKLIHSEIAYIKAQHNIEIGDIDAEIVEVRSKIKLNNQLTKDFAEGSDKNDHSQDPLQLKEGSLSEQKKMHLTAMEIKIADVIQSRNTDYMVLGNQIRLLERELELLQDEKKKLNKHASFNGVISNVYVKDGEEVVAFSSLLSAYPAHPTTVIGYKSGHVESALSMGAIVTILSYDHHQITVPGKVIGFGSVVELPQILQKSTAVKAFGREVFIEVDANNGFATGEKVLIK